MTRTKERILLAAARLLAKNPGISVSDIAIEAEVGRATLHRYFSKREDLINELVLFALKKTNGIVQEVLDSDLPPKRKLEATIQRFIPMGDLFHFLMTDSTIYTNDEAKLAYQNQVDSMLLLVETAKKRRYYFG